MVGLLIWAIIIIVFTAGAGFLLVLVFGVIISALVAFFSGLGNKNNKL